MIVLRRTVAVFLVLFVIVAFALALAASRITATVMAPDFYVEQLRTLDAYALVHDDVLPRAVDDFLQGQNEKLPDNLSSVALPTDARSQQAILDLLRVALPPEVLQAHAEAAIDAIVPYLTGARDDFDVRIRLGDELRAIAGHDPGAPSLLQRTWRELNLAEATLAGLTQARADTGADAAADDERPPDLIDAVGGDVPGASAWFETQLFGALDQLVPYFTGESEHVRIVIRFDDYPVLAEPFSTALNRPPEELLRDGFVIDDREINAELAKSGRAEINTSDNALAVFRPEGYSFTAQQLRDRQTASGDGSGDGLATDEMRTWASRVRLLRWGVLLLVAVLVATIGVLGGRRWPSRVAWAASAMLVASVTAFVIAGPVYRVTAGAMLERTIADQRAESDGVWQPVEDRLLDRAEAVVDGMAGRAAATSRNWALLSVLALVGVVGWTEYDRRRPARTADTIATRRAHEPPAAPRTRAG